MPMMANRLRAPALPLVALVLGLGVACAPAAPTPPTNAPAAAPAQARASPAAAPAPAQAQASPVAGAQAQPAASPAVFTAGAAPAQAAASCSGQLRKLTLGVAVAPPNVVHTSPFVARALGIFAKHCIDANIVQFEGGLSQTSLTAVAQGAAMGPLNESAIGAGLKGKQVWGMAPKPPQAYVVGENIKTAADLKGKRLIADGGA